MRVLFALWLGVVVPDWAAAQTAPPTLPLHDVIVSGAWAGAQHSVRDQRPWHGSLLVGASAGRFWTDHAKTEVEASWTSPHDGNYYETLEIDGAYTWAVGDYRSHDLRVGVAQLYQFGRNQWIHPYAGIGADIVRREALFVREPQSRTVYVGNQSVSLELPAARERTTRVFAEAVLRTGLKMYVTDRAFFNTELKLGVKRGVDHVAWKLGLGVDF